VKTHRKLKILHVVERFNIGGLENGVVNLVNRSDPEVFEHCICCVRESGPSSDRLIRKVPIFEMHKGVGNDWAIIPKLARLFKEVCPDAVHTRNWGTTDGIIAARLSGISTVIHGEHGWNMDDPRGEVLRRRVARRLLSPFVTRFVTVSDDIRRWLHEKAGIRLGKISRIVNGVDTDKFRPRDKQEAKKRIGLEDKTVVGIVSRLDPIKRHDLLMRAFEAVQVRCPAAKLVVVGDGPERAHLERIRARMSDPGSVIFLGQRDDVAEVYPAMDVFVLPSENEGISNTILEAMSCGIPVVATAVGGNPELVTDGVSGTLVPPGKIQDLRRALRHYLEKPGDRELHGRNARRDAVERFSLERMVREYEDLYLSLTRRKGKRMGSRFRTKD